MTTAMILDNLKQAFYKVENGQLRVYYNGVKTDLLIEVEPGKDYSKLQMSDDDRKIVACIAKNKHYLQDGG